MKRKKVCRSCQRETKIHLLTNLVLGVLVLSVGALCLSPADSALQTNGASGEIYRHGGEDSKSVSLMFNVYWGTEEVYRILDILRLHQAKATFFIGGCWADDNADCLKRIDAEGHELGNHGYFHKDHAKLSVTENRKEISACNRFIQLATQKTPTLFAPPSGAYGEDTLTACKALGMKTVLWSRDTIDWRDKNASLIYTRATKGVQGGEFVLMHPMQETADALEDILKYYESVSISVVTVSEHLKL